MNTIQNAQNLFISFEGGEGCGKSVMVARVAERLAALGRAIVRTREPGGTPYAEKIRALVFNKENVQEEIHARTEVLLFSASRAQHVECLIRPALAEGTIVLTDRYSDSTRAYQGAGRTLSRKERVEIERVIAFAECGIRPSLTILLNVDVQIGIARRRNVSGKDMTRFDKENLAFHERIRGRFLALARKDPVRWRVIDASQPLKDVERDVWAVVSSHLKI